MQDEDYIENKRSDMIYVSSPFKIGHAKDKDAHYVSRVFDDAERSAFDFVNDEIVIRATHKSKIQVKAVVTTDQNSIKSVTIQSFRLYKKEGWRPDKEFAINLYGQELRALIDFIDLATKMDISQTRRMRLDSEALSHLDLDDAARKWIASNPEALQGIVDSQLTSRDVVAVAYRKKQIEVFERLLSDEKYFAKCLTDKRFHGSAEAVWQGFFEANRWIFGYGLFHLSVEGFRGVKLEQIVSGATVTTAGKKIDALMRTRGRLSSIALVEIKKHTTSLLAQPAYRSGAWAPSDELAGAVAQMLVSVDGLERQYGGAVFNEGQKGQPKWRARLDRAAALGRSVRIARRIHDRAWSQSGQVPQLRVVQATLDSAGHSYVRRVARASTADRRVCGKLVPHDEIGCTHKCSSS